jgi:hypothetical protein
LINHAYLNMFSSRHKPSGLPIKITDQYSDHSGMGVMMSHKEGEFREDLIRKRDSSSLLLRSQSLISMLHRLDSSKGPLLFETQCTMSVFIHCRTNRESPQSPGVYPYNVSPQFLSLLGGLRPSFPSLLYAGLILTWPLITKFIKSARKLQAFKLGDEWPPGAKRRLFRRMPETQGISPGSGFILPN